MCIDRVIERGKGSAQGGRRLRRERQVEGLQPWTQNPGVGVEIQAINAPDFQVTWSWIISATLGTVPPRGSHLKRYYPTGVPGEPTARRTPFL
jgi:hypothetical protein